MRQAPAVRLLTSPPLAWRLLQALLTALAAAAVAAWLASHAAVRGDLLMAIAVVAGTIGGLIGWRMAASGPTCIDWDGAQWTLDPDTDRAAPLSRLQVMIDLERFVLVRGKLVAPPGRRRWLALALDRRSASERALCVALFAAQETAASQATPHLHG